MTSQFSLSERFVNLAALLVCGSHSEMSISFDVAIGLVSVKYGWTKSEPASFTEHRKSWGDK